MYQLRVQLVHSHHLRTPDFSTSGSLNQRASESMRICAYARMCLDAYVGVRACVEGVGCV